MRWIVRKREFFIQLSGLISTHYLRDQTRCVLSCLALWISTHYLRDQTSLQHGLVPLLRIVLVEISTFQNDSILLLPTKFGYFRGFKES
jgi:hypothetical protein